MSYILLHYLSRYFSRENDIQMKKFVKKKQTLSKCYLLVHLISLLSAVEGFDPFPFLVSSFLFFAFSLVFFHFLFLCADVPKFGFPFPLQTTKAVIFFDTKHCLGSDRASALGGFCYRASVLAQVNVFFLSKL